MGIQLRSILFPTDFSETSDHALQYAVALAEQFRARIDMVHVVEEVAITQHISVTLVDTGEIIEHLVADAKKRLAGYEKDHVPAGIKTKCTTLRGTPFLEVIRYAREHESDVVVMGTHGRTGLAHVVMGSTAEKVVRHSPCPVLTVRSPGHEFQNP